MLDPKLAFEVCSMRMKWTWLITGILLGVALSWSFFTSSDVNQSALPAVVDVPQPAAYSVDFNHRSGKTDGPVEIDAAAALEQRVLKTVQADPANIDAQNRAGEFYISVAREPAKALPYLQESMRLRAAEGSNSEDPDGVTNRALQLMVDIALSALEKPVKERAAKIVAENAINNPGSAEAQMALGDLEMGRKNPAAALRAYQAGAKLGSSRSHQMAGDIFLENGNFESAANEMAAAERIKANALDRAHQNGEEESELRLQWEEARTKLSVSLMAKGDLATAKEINEAQIKLDPQNGLLKKISENIHAREIRKR